MRRVGLGWRRELAGWIDSRPPEVECLEVTAEHFYDGGEPRLEALRGRYPLMVHGLGLSLGTPGPLDRRTLADFARVAEAADPLWVSEHVAFTRTGEVDLGHLNPLPPTERTLATVAEHALELAERCGRPVLLENIASALRPEGTLSEPAFLNRLCETAGCGLLLDVTNLFVNSRNHRFDPRRWLDDLELGRVVQLHVAGHSRVGARWEDRHAAAVQEEIWDLVAEVCERAPVQAATLERDADFPPPEELAGELRRLRTLLG